MMNYKKALRKAAEEMYNNEMYMTQMDVLEVKEEIKKNHSEEEWIRQIEDASYENKEEWIQEKINEWLSDE